MAIELTLKAYLHRSGVRKSKIREVGHNLGKLLKLCVMSKLHVSETQARLVLLAAQSHSIHYFRYGPDIQKSSHVILLADVSGLLKAAAELIDISSGDPTVIRGAQPWTTARSEWPIALPALHPIDLTQLNALQKRVEAESERYRALNSQLKTAAAPAFGSGRR